MTSTTDQTDQRSDGNVTSFIKTLCWWLAAIIAIVALIIGGKKMVAASTANHTGYSTQPVSASKNQVYRFTMSSESPSPAFQVPPAAWFTYVPIPASTNLTLQKRVGRNGEWGAVNTSDTMGAGHYRLVTTEGQEFPVIVTITPKYGR